MAAKGYCTADDVAAWLGQTFTAGQETHCGNLIARAERTIDEETGRGWLVGAQTDEKIYPDSRQVYLRYAPVASVASVTGRAGLGEAEEPLTADEDYEVRNLESGLVLLEQYAWWERLLVTYTPVASVPEDITQACIEMAATWMGPHLNPGSFGLDSYSLPDLTVKFARSHVQEAIPPAAQKIINRYRYKVHA